MSLWLAAWVVPMAYGLYCRSVDEFDPPAEWLRPVGGWFAGHGLAIALDLLVLATLGFLFRAVRGLFGIVLGLALLAIAGAAYFNWPFYQAWDRAAGWPATLVDSGVAGALLLGAAPVLWWAAGATVGRRCLKALQLAAVVAVIFGLCQGVYWGLRRDFEAKADKVLADYRADRFDRAQAGSWARWYPLMLAGHGNPTREQWVDRLMERYVLERRFDRNRAEGQFFGLEDARRLAEQKMDGRRLEERGRRWDALVAEYAAEYRAAHPGEAPAAGRRAADVAADPAAQYAAGRAAEWFTARQVTWEVKWESAWMPRYLGVVWPAVAIAACGLLCRLPTRPLRWAAVGLLLGVNVAQGAARLFAGSEPPMDRIIRDVAAAQPTDRAGRPTHTDTRTYTLLPGTQGAGHPGSLSLKGFSAQPSRYYQSLEAGVMVTPLQYRREFEKHVKFQFWPESLSWRGGLGDSLASDLRLSPQIKRVILWQMELAAWNYPTPAQERYARESAKEDEQSLERWRSAGRWKLAGDEIFAGRMHWTWRDWYTLRRREYVRE